MAAPVLLGLNLDLGQKRLGLKIRSSFIYKRIPKFTDKIYAAKIISPRSCLQAIYSRLLSNGFVRTSKDAGLKMKILEIFYRHKYLYHTRHKGGLTTESEAFHVFTLQT